MIPAAVTASEYIYSKLGSNASLLPLAVKDLANSTGLTAGSYITGDKLEGKDYLRKQLPTIHKFPYLINKIFLS